MVFTSTFLSQNEQGYYYVIVSIASLCLLFELGLSSLLTTAAAHMFNGLAWNSERRVVGHELFKFIGLAQYSFKWYVSAAFISFFVICPLGGLYVSSAVLDAEVDWIGPWILLMIATSIALLPTPMIVIVEGTGGVSESYLVRFLQAFVGSAAVLVVLYLGGGLYAAAMPAVGAATVGGLWLLLQRRGFVIQVLKEARHELAARKGLFALQWRATISWLAGYVMVLMYVPLLFKTQGSAVSGQMAITMNIVNMSSVLAAAWVIGRLPSIANCIATQKWSEADSIFNKYFLISIVFYVLGGLTIIGLRVLLSYTVYDERVLSLLETIVLIMGMGFYHVSGLLASYLRAYLKEPMVKVSMIAAVVTAILAVIIAPRWGSYGIVWLVFFVNGLFMFPVTAYLYIKLRGEWQSE